MEKRAVVKKNAYYDSVSLMAISKKIKEMEGVLDAVVSMGTPMNKEHIENAGLMTEEARNSGPSDLIIAFSVIDEIIGDKVLDSIEAALKKKHGSGSAKKEAAPIGLDSAMSILPQANIAVISLPGEYAFREAMQALRKGLHVIMFSDNVRVEEEVELKKYAHEKGLLMMGPDCGTAVINNKGICFANAVKSGNIGIVGASGTGMQEVLVLIDRLGGGISQAIGTGGRDLSEAVGGIMMCDALAALNEDPMTDVIVLVSKPPQKSVMDKVLDEVKKCSKPTVVCFINTDVSDDPNGIYFEKTLERAARRAVSLSTGKVDADLIIHNENAETLNHFVDKMLPSQKYVRGLFCGGTLCDEGMYIFKESLQENEGKVYSNISKDPLYKLENPHRSAEHSFIDLGDDAFTVGKPHPMIDPALRSARIVQEAEDESVAVILIDVVLGYGSHRDPAGEAATAIKRAKELLGKQGRTVCFIAYICGTENDVQNLQAQKSKLIDEGVIIANSNAEAAGMAVSVIGGLKQWAV